MSEQVTITAVEAAKWAATFAGMDTFRPYCAPELLIVAHFSEDVFFVSAKPRAEFLEAIGGEDNASRFSEAALEADRQALRDVEALIAARPGEAAAFAKYVRLIEGVNGDV